MTDPLAVPPPSERPPALRRSGSPTPDLTVAIVTYLGRERILDPLRSLQQQDADPHRFEVLVVPNGPDDGTAELVRGWAEDSLLRVRIVSTPFGGMAAARNLALQAANGTYLTWLDDDDSVSSNFVEGMLGYAHPRKVVLPFFSDVSGSYPDALSYENYINRSVLRFPGQTVHFADLPTAASFDAGKVVATAAARSAVYDPRLSSGLDVLYWSEVILKNRLSVVVPDLARRPVYYRTVRSGSASRRTDDQFGEERLTCIAKLEELKSRYPRGAATLDALQGGQAANLGNWLRHDPGKRKAVLSRIDELGISHFPYRVVNRNSAEKLVVAYAFPPVMDTSGMVAAKRLLLEGNPYDLVTHSMRGARELDPAAGVLVDEHLGNRVRMDGKPVSAHVPRIADFCAEAFAGLLQRERSLGPYRELYSRAMWPAAHVMGAAYKIRHPETTWTAEFSDPLLIDVMGGQRFGALPPHPLVSSIQHAVDDAGFGYPTGNFYAWLETVTFALADRIVFTNHLQRELMLQHAAHPDLAARVTAVSEISHHPVLPSSYYSLIRSEYELDPDRVNIGYFGVFYGSRDVNDLLDALAHLAPTLRERVLLHIFTNKPEESAGVVAGRGLERCVRVNRYRPFLEFLNLTTRLDWLVVADAKVSSSHGLNPYLPSKYADYRGSGTSVWSIVEPGSTLDSLPAEAKTRLGDVEAAAELLRTLGTQASAATTPTKRFGAASPAHREGVGDRP